MANDRNPFRRQVIELGNGSFFGEPAVLGFASRLETIVCTRSCTMMTLNLDHMDELCQLSYEFKTELMVIACERMVRNRVPKEVCTWCLRDFAVSYTHLTLPTTPYV